MTEHARPPAVNPPQHDQTPVPAARVPALDGVRGLAVLAVLVLHFTLLTPQSPAEHAFAALASSGWMGVDLFFVLSGFLITGILLDTKGRPHYFWNFVAKRSLRILPLYFAYLAGVFLLLPRVLPSVATEPQAEGRIWVWTYLTNVLLSRSGWDALPSHTTHLWSLSVEEQFYLLWPGVVLLCRPRQLAIVCVALITGAQLFRITSLVVGAAPEGAYVLLPARMDSLAVGALLAIALREAPHRIPARTATWMTGVGLALVVIAAAINVQIGNPAFGMLSGPMQAVGYTGAVLMSGAVVLWAARSGGAGLAGRAFLSPILQRFGKYSYGMYVLHVPLRNSLRNRLDLGQYTVAGSAIPAQVLLLAAAIAVTYGLAALSWHLFEKHFLTLKSRFEH